MHAVLKRVVLAEFKVPSANPITDSSNYISRHKIRQKLQVKMLSLIKTKRFNTVFQNRRYVQDC